MKIKKRILYLDLLKIISTILVIYNHSHWYLQGNSRFFKFLYIISFNICKIAVPIFIMITGALILNKKTTYENILKKRIPRIAIATLISTIIGAIIYKKDLLFIISSLWSGQTQTLYFLWYVYIIILLYLLAPLITKMIKKFNDKDYKMFIITFIIIPSIIIFIPYFFKEVFNQEVYITSRLIASSFLVNIGLLVLGNYINQKKITEKINKKMNIYIIISFIIGLIYVYFGYKNQGKMPDFYYNTFPPTILAICTFIKCKYYFNNKKENKYTTILSESSFGVYLTHVYLIDYIANTKLYSNLLNRYNLISYLFLLLITYTLLTLLFYLIKKIKVFKKIF